VARLLLLATPSEIPGYARAFDLRHGVPTMLIHGWRDDVCPPEWRARVCRKRRLPLLMLDDDHRLGASMDVIAAQFRMPARSTGDRRMSHYFATCPKGLEYLLRDELIAIGASDVREALAGAHFSGTLETAYRACLWSRLASRILLPLAEFDAADDDALYRGVQDRSTGAASGRPRHASRSMPARR
jgi:hypothetical protein